MHQQYRVLRIHVFEVDIFVNVTHGNGVILFGYLHCALDLFDGE